MLRKVLLMGCSVVIMLAVSSSVQATTQADPGLAGPYPVGQVGVTISNPGTGSALNTTIYYPSGAGGVASAGAPYPGIVFAPGTFSIAGDYSGNGAHLASWGYVVAVPRFPFPSSDINLETRAADVGYLLTYLAAENADMSSLFYQKIDTARFGLAGHSLGGVTVMIVAARDSRVQAVVALDPASAPQSILPGWDYQQEAPGITAPLAVIGAPAQPCNVNAMYNDIYPYVGAEHKAKFVVSGGSHCDFMDAENPWIRSACYVVCGGQYSEPRVQLVERYTTAWLNHYLYADSQSYTYLYGAQSDADILAGRVTREMQTAPRGLTATGEAGAIRLSWSLSSYAVIAGYNIYRREAGGAYPAGPSAAVGRQSSYLDGDVVAGREYFYVLRSRDAAGDEYQTSAEAHAVPGECSTPTPTSTPASTPTLTTGARYNIYLPLSVENRWSSGVAR